MMNLRAQNLVWGRNWTLVVLVALTTALLSLSGCVTYLPIDEWNLARSAYNSAKEADAPRYVPKTWFVAEQSYRDAQKAYKDRRYPESTVLFKRARELCEQAENQARLEKFQSGDVVP